MTELLATASDPSASSIEVYEVNGMSGPGRITVNVLLSIPREQAYYWTAAWQRDERESLAEIESGNSILFDSDDPEDVARWLRGDEDDQPEQ